MNEGQGFQFTPFGITALGDASGAQGDDVMPADARIKQVIDAPSESPGPQTRHIPQLPAKTQASRVVGPINVVREAKRRITELRAEIRRLRSLEKELHELERLVTAAKKPVAIVRTIDTRARNQKL